MGWARKEVNMKHSDIKKPFMPMNLQFFAEGGEGDGAGDDSGTGTGALEDKGNGEGDEGAGNQTFDDILTNAEYQAEFDRRVQKAINTAVTKQKEAWQTSLDDKLTEAEKLAKMTKEQKAEYMSQKKEKELSAREAELNKKELIAEAKGTLAEKKLPSNLVDLLDYSSAENCNKSIASLETAFNEAVETAVQDKIKGGATLKKAGSNSNATLEEQVMNAMKAF